MAKITNKVQDKYSNVLIARVDESSANTLTFQEVPQITTLLEKKAFLINRLQYFASSSLVTTDTDVLNFGISLSNKWSAPALTEPSILDFQEVRGVASGTPASLWVHQQPFDQDYSTLPGEGLLVPTRPLYLWTKGTNLGAASAVILKLFFTIIELTPQDYWDLVESLQAFT